MKGFTKKLIVWLGINAILLTLLSPLAMADYQSTAQTICSGRGLEGDALDECIQEQVAEMEANAADLADDPSAEEAGAEAQENFMAEDDEQQNLHNNLISCDSADIFLMPDISAQMGATNASFVMTELYEPIGSFEQKIKSGNVTVSQVFWKFNCVTKNPKDWVQKEEECRTACEWEVKTVPTKDNKLVKISGYSPYEKGCPQGAQCSIVQVIIGQSGTGILKTYVAIIYRWAAGIVGIIAVLVIVISGIQISIDQGSGEGVTAAKNRITQSLAGLVILFLSALILYTINPTFFTK